MRKVTQAIEAYQYTVENQTDIVVGQIELLERMNLNTSAKYAQMTKYIQPSVELADEYNNAKTVLADAQTQLASIDNLVGDLEKIAQEMEQWSAELLVKIRRVAR